jgi:hypothetical protein
MTRLEGMSMRTSRARAAYAVLAILLLILVTGLWAYLWVH